MKFRSFNEILDTRRSTYTLYRKSLLEMENIVDNQNMTNIPRLHLIIRAEVIKGEEKSTRNISLTLVYEGSDDVIHQCNSLFMLLMGSAPTIRKKSHCMHGDGGFMIQHTSVNRRKISDLIIKLGLEIPFNEEKDSKNCNEEKPIVNEIMKPLNPDE
jgi:hypothetical protein